jgi:nitric oxide reductase activation protein
MQLPRGTFREIKKKTPFGGLLEELQQTRFTGICTISFGTANGIIVFKSGKRILAEFQNIVGDAAWDDLQKIVEETVGVSLSTLDEAQIQLSLEFNKPCRIVKAGKAEQSPLPDIPSTQQHTAKKSPLARPKTAGDALVKNQQKPVIPERTPLNQSVPVENQHTPEPSKKTVTSHSTTKGHKTSAAVPLQSQDHIQKQDEKDILIDEISNQADSSSSNFDKDIDTFETMDVEAITNKIRGECKTIIKQLQLEHLTER